MANPESIKDRLLIIVDESQNSDYPETISKLIFLINSLPNKPEIDVDSVAIIIADKVKDACVFGGLPFHKLPDIIRQILLDNFTDRKAVDVEKLINKFQDLCYSYWMDEDHVHNFSVATVREQVTKILTNAGIK